MTDFFSKNASAIFGLVGAFGGGGITFLATWLVKKREYDLRLWDKLLERRIKAHENVMAVAQEMRVMVCLGGVDENGEVARAPQVLLSKEEFEMWFTKFAQLSMEGSSWLTTEAKRELNFVQDYLVTLHQNLSGVPSERYLQVGQFIRQDFIDLSSELEKKIFNFFESEIRKLKLNDLNEWHKYGREVTEKRLNDTTLLKSWNKVHEIANLGRS